MTKNGKRNFFILFFPENPLAKNGKKIKKRKKFRAKRKGESGAEAEAGRLGQFIFSKKMPVRLVPSENYFLAKKRPCGGESPLTIF